MKLTIRERGQRVAQYLWSKGKQTIRGIARATGLSTSSVYRHQQGIERRAQHPESYFWETAAGSGWLKVLVDWSGLLLWHQTGSRGSRASRNS